jgi:hypothetical protein
MELRGCIPPQDATSVEPFTGYRDFECLDALDASSTSTVWTGDRGAKGLAIVGFKGWRIASCETLISEQWFLPAIAERGAAKVQIVGVWVKPADGYVAPTLRALQTLRGL